MLMLSMQCESSKYASYSDGQQWRQEGSARILGSPGGLKLKTENDQICVVNLFSKNTTALQSRAPGYFTQARGLALPANGIQ